MDLKFLEDLNEEQLEAATNFEGPMLILAGAGSGKTKTIVARTANMIAHGKNPNSILILTFTNKAGREMKERGLALLDSLDYRGNMPTFSTFHTFGLKLLKTYISECEKFGLYDGFSISDEKVQEKIIKSIIKDKYAEDLKLKDCNFLSVFTIIQNNLVRYDSVEEAYEDIMSLITRFKQNNKPISFLLDNGFENKRDIRKLAEIYVEYKRILRENNSVDFDDLINLPIRIMEENAHVSNILKKRYKYIMVDEFQDTNLSQIKFLNLILNEEDNICVVGDDSQAIYGWRGADIEFILNFHKKFDKVKKISLSKNYRSTMDILSVANNLIGSACQKHEFKEALQAFKKKSGKIFCRSLFNEFEEARVVSFAIKALLEKNKNPSEIAVLYRNNFLVHTLEKEMIKNKIPYRIFKGRTLLQKKAVQEYLAFINFFTNKSNSIALENAFLSSAKILTETKIDELKRIALTKKMSLVDYVFKGDYRETTLSKVQKEKVLDFVKKSNELIRLLETGLDNETFLIFFYENFTLFKELENTVKNTNSIKVKEQAESALFDLNLLNSIIMEFKTIKEFLETTVLDGENEEDEKSFPKVNLMTIHTSKGLEFDYVFIVRMNQGILPSNRSLCNAETLEEERRLAYVAITRARKYLHVSYIKDGRNGRELPSQFIRESGLDKINPITKKY